MSLLEDIEASLLVPRSNPQTLISTSRFKKPVPYVDRTSGNPWPSGGSLPFIAWPMFPGWAVGYAPFSSPTPPSPTPGPTPRVFNCSVNESITAIDICHLPSIFDCSVIESLTAVDTCRFPAVFSDSVNESLTVVDVCYLPAVIDCSVTESVSAVDRSSTIDALQLEDGSILQLEDMSQLELG